MATNDPNSSGPAGPAAAEENPKDLNYYMPLHKAARKGDWESARNFFDQDPDAATAIIAISSKTALHVAAVAGHEQFVVKLVERMPSQALALQCGRQRTALHYAAISGITNGAKAMVTKNSDLPLISSQDGWTPLIFAACYEQIEMVKYLLSVTTNECPHPFTGSLGAQLLTYTAAAGFYDVCLDLVQSYPQLATTRNQFGDTVLRVLAQKPSAFYSGCQLGFWQRCIYPYVPVGLDDTLRTSVKRDMENPNQNTEDVTHKPIWFRFLKSFLFQVPGMMQVKDAKLAHIQTVELVKHVCAQISTMKHSEMLHFFAHSDMLSLAAEFGVYELVKECVESFPDIIGFMFNGRTIFHRAVEHRREKIFDLIHGINGEKKGIAVHKVKSDTILHLAARLAPSPQLNSVSGAALQMQRELQWYKEVETVVLPIDKELKNSSGKTARVVFTEEHKDLVEKGEKWLKDTAQSCMVVATLIATVVFAGAFTVPGGNNGEKGTPIFLREKSFMVFMISDALALFSSCTSVLMFLSILTSRYAEEDFLKSLPKRLIIGLASLFFSIATMIIAFGATLFIVLSKKWAWVSIPISLLSCIPVVLFVWLQLPLFVEMVYSTYGPGIFRRQSIKSY